MPNIEDAKSMAKALESALRAKSVDVSHGECLDIVARQFGLKDWNVLSSKAKRHAVSSARRSRKLRAWSFIAEHEEAYDHGQDVDSQPPEQNTALIRFDPEIGRRRYTDLVSAFGCYAQTVSSVPFAGKRIEIEAKLLCDGVTHGVTIWARVDGPQGDVLAFDNLKSAEDGWLFGDVPWTARRIVIEAPTEGCALHYGFFLKGSGSLRVKDFSVAEAADSSSPMAEPVARQRREAAWLAPTNLQFSDVVDRRAIDR